MSEEGRTLYIGNLDEKVTDELIYELLLQAGPLERVILPSEGESKKSEDDVKKKRHNGSAYIVFKHPASVNYAVQVFDGTSLFNKKISMKARSMPSSMRSPHSSGSSRSQQKYDNSSLRTGFNRSSTWHGRDNFASKNKHRQGNFNQISFNPGFNNYNNQGNQGNFWSGGNNSGDLQSNQQQQPQQMMQNQQTMNMSNAPNMFMAQNQGQWNNNFQTSNTSNNFQTPNTWNNSYNQFNSWYPR